MIDGCVEASRIGRRPKGDVFCIDVLLRYSRPEALTVAIEKARAGRMVFVRREDAAAVLAALSNEEAEDER